ncbi:helix-turn-helix domain-containing protein [Streptomyces sp. NPDC046716]|uniref:helix-turn-helix domain-containing protein n=1 Tax=Streptomyces sp. NPDC046716 TaxID=3157093 RepID=UPI0033C143BE
MPRAGQPGDPRARYLGSVVTGPGFGSGGTVRVREQLAEAASWEERFTRVGAVLARRRAQRPPVDPEVARAWRRIAAQPGLIRVDLGWSRRRLWARFGAQLGMPPKHAAKLIRFDRAVHRLVAGESTAQVAVDTGYFDQSRLHRDIRSFTGLTPRAVAGEPFLTVDDTVWPDAAPMS